MTAREARELTEGKLEIDQSILDKIYDTIKTKATTGYFFMTVNNHEQMRAITIKLREEGYKCELTNSKHWIISWD